MDSVAIGDNVKFTSTGDTVWEVTGANDGVMVFEHKETFNKLTLPTILTTTMLRLGTLRLVSDVFRIAFTLDGQTRTKLTASSNAELTKIIELVMAWGGGITIERMSGLTPMDTRLSDIMARLQAMATMYRRLSTFHSGYNNWSGLAEQTEQIIADLKTLDNSN